MLIYGFCTEFKPFFYNPKVIRNLLATEKILSSKPMADYASLEKIEFNFESQILRNLRFKHTF